jgi:hypothetical protein|tara:strand:- start:414 stop:629 length:216 start_codon:yes stop_codon:yes gene_type:complete
MKFEDAIQRSIKDFLKGNSASKTAETAEGGLYYTPEFFDEFEEKFLEATKGLKVTKKSKSKSKKGEDENEV